MSQLETSQNHTPSDRPTPDPTHVHGARPGRRLLRRSKQNRVIGGVCGGFARYVDTEPVLFRIAFLLLLIPGGLGLLLYLISWIAMPEFRNEQDERADNTALPLERGTAGMVVGGLLILIGLMILLDRIVDWFDPRIVGGTLLIAIGIVVIWRGLQSEGAE